MLPLLMIILLFKEKESIYIHFLKVNISHASHCSFLTLYQTIYEIDSDSSHFLNVSLFRLFIVFELFFNPILDLCFHDALVSL